MKSTLILLAALLAGCATSTPVDKPPFAVTFEDKTYVALQTGMELVAVGDLVMYRTGGRYLVGRVTALRGEGVFRIAGDGLVLVSSSNYAGKLWPAN